MPARKIILIMTDTQRWDMLGCYGNPAMKTPALDGLAGQGQRFERAYTCQPVCAPARSALFTGSWPHSNGVWGNSMPLGDTVRTLGRRLRDAALHTAYIGKWHLDGGDYFGLGRCPDGWDPAFWYDMRNYLEELSPEQRRRSRDVRSMDAPGGIGAGFTFGSRCSDRAIRFLSRHAEEDFFLVVSYDEPHAPFLCPEPYASMHPHGNPLLAAGAGDEPADKPEHIRIWAESVRAGGAPAGGIGPDRFLGCNSWIDSEIGRVLEAVDRHAPDALVIYTSDHGDALGAHGITNKGPAVFDQIARIPLIVRWPGVTSPGSVCPHPVSHIDLAPTIFEAAAVARPPVFDGTGLAACLRDPRVRVNEAIFMEFGRYEADHDGFGGFQPLRAAFDGRFKLAINLLASDELYDLEADPDELVNRIDDKSLSAERDRLHNAILDWMNRTRDPFRGYYWERRPWRRDARPASWSYTSMTRQREDETYEPRQLDYDTGLPMREATRPK